MRTDGPQISAEVVDACRAGERDALRALYETYKDKVYSVALYHFHGDAHVAEDVTQQVFVKAMTSIHEFRGDSGIGTWLYRLTVNACLDRQRRRQGREIPLAPEKLDGAGAARRECDGTPEASMESNQREQRVRAAISSLPEKLRLPVLLRYFEDLSYEEMGRALDCSPGTVASRLNRGHQLLREKLQKWGIR